MANRRWPTKWGGIGVQLLRGLPTAPFGQAVYGKQTHTNQYIGSLSHHPPGQKHAAQSILVYRAMNIANTKHLEDELKLLKQVWAQYGYNPRDVD